MKPIGKVIAAVISVLVIWCGPVCAEKTVVTAEGKYVMGDLDSKKDAKTLALMEAKRISLEKAGTYIESVSEVKNYQLTKDQINTLAAGVMSIEILKEDWKMSGENMVLVLSIRATIDTSDLKSRITAMQEGQGAGGYKEIKAQLASLQRELADLKAKQAAVKDRAAPKPETQEKHDGIIKKMSALEYLEDGNASLRVQRWNEAIEAYKRALAVDLKQADAYAGMSLAFQQTGQTEKALEAVNTAQKINPKSALSHNAMAKILYDQGKYDDALKSSNRAIELWSKSPYFYSLRGEIYIKLKNRELALKDFNQACIMKLTWACQRPALVYTEDGHAALRVERWNEAIATYKRALAIDPKQADAYAGMSLAFQYSGQSEKALDAVNTAQKINPESALSHRAMAKILYDQGKYNAALESINRAIELWSKSPYNYSFRGEIYIKLKNLELAIKDFNQACIMKLTWACQMLDKVKQQAK